jgi:hypothetical protein
MVDDLLTGDLLPERDEDRLLDVIGQTGCVCPSRATDGVANEATVLTDQRLEASVGLPGIHRGVRAL